MNEYKDYDINMIYPPPPSPFLMTNSFKNNKKIQIEYEQEMKKWREGFNNWSVCRAENNRGIESRWEILDI